MQGSAYTPVSSVNHSNHYAKKLRVAGVDEAGRGPLAGPVIAAAVILDEPIQGLKDSKKLTPKKRSLLAQTIQEKAFAYAYGRCEADEIDQLNIHQATLQAMRQAILNLSTQPSQVLVDGKFCPHMDIPMDAVIGGDMLIQEISAASILAKVLRDQEMIEYDARYPGYGFAQHKGYPTVAHRQALKQIGPCAIHRKSFAPVKQIELERIKQNTMLADRHQHTLSG